MIKKIDYDELFLCELGQSVKFRQHPKLKLVLVERLFAEFLDPNKPRRIIYACKDLRVGEIKLHPQQTLSPWPETQKTQSSNITNMIGEA